MRNRVGSTFFLRDSPGWGVWCMLSSLWRKDDLWVEFVCDKYSGTDTIYCYLVVHKTCEDKIICRIDIIPTKLTKRRLRTKKKEHGNQGFRGLGRLCYHESWRIDALLGASCEGFCEGFKGRGRLAEERNINIFEMRCVNSSHKAVHVLAGSSIFEASESGDKKTFRWRWRQGKVAPATGEGN
jgi:hypothetical protein